MEKERDFKEDAHLTVRAGKYGMGRGASSLKTQRQTRARTPSSSVFSLKDFNQLDEAHPHII